MLLLPLVSALPACDYYYSPVPLADAADAPLDERLLGQWVALDDDAEAGLLQEVAGADTVGIQVYRFSEHEYLIEWPEYVCRNFRTPELMDHRMRAFITVIDNVRFLNLQDIGDDTDYLIARYSFTPDLRLDFIRDGSGERGLGRKYRSSPELFAAVHARLNDPKLFDSDSVVLRSIRSLVSQRAPQLW